MLGVSLSLSSFFEAVSGAVGVSDRKPVGERKREAMGKWSTDSKGESRRA